MARSSYHQVAQLAMHPAFSHAAVALVCPLDGDGDAFTTMRFGEYNRHFLAHDPTQAQAYQWLDWRTYRRAAKAKGWQDDDAILGPPAGPQRLDSRRPGGGTTPHTRR